MKRISLLLLLVVLPCNFVLAQNKTLSLDGDGDYMEVSDSDSLDLVTAITAEMWVQVSSLVGGDVDIFLNKENSYEFGIVNTTGYGTPRQNFTFALSVNGGWAETNSNGWYDGGQQLELGQWYHVAITYDGKEAKAYVDGGTIRKISSHSEEKARYYSVGNGWTVYSKEMLANLAC